MASYPNPWRAAVLEIAEKRGGLDSLILKAAAPQVASREGLLVACAAIGFVAADSLLTAIEHEEEFGAGG